MSVEEILKSGKYNLIDVREPLELEMDGEISSAVNIPLGELENRKQEVQNMEGPKIFFCRSGNRSGKAAALFSDRDDVYNGGGYEDVKKQVDNA